MDEQQAGEELVPQSEPGMPDGAHVAPAIPPLRAEDVPEPVANLLVPNTAPPPVAEQRSSHVNASKLASEKVVIAAPMSLAGSAARIWKLTGLTDQPVGRIALGLGAVLLIALAWTVVLAWYLCWGVFLIPYRMIRRGSRKRKREALQHREQLAAIESLRPPTD
jgi:hypothetical protein